MISMTNPTHSNSYSLYSPGVVGNTGTSNRVYVIDENKPVMNIVSMLLEQAGFVVRVYRSSIAFEEEFADLPSGVVFTDQVMSPVDANDACSKVLSRPDHFRVIVVLAYPNTKLTVAAMKFGAVTVLEKPFERQELIGAVKEGFRQLQEIQASRDIDPAATPGNLALMNSLTLREREIIELVYDGHTNKAISLRLKIHCKTVEKHRSNVMKKLGVSSLAELIRLLTVREPTGR